MLTRTRAHTGAVGASSPQVKRALAALGMPASVDLTTPFWRSTTPVVEPVALVDFDGLVQAQRVARLEEDGALNTRLALQGYEGPEWTRFALVMAEYGWEVMRVWTRNGQIFAECARKRRGIGRYADLPRSLRRALDEDAVSLASITVAESIKSFRADVLRKQRWNPTKGATLKTFFIGHCVGNFPNIYREWLADLDRPGADLETVAKELEALASAPVAVDVGAECARAVDRLGRLPDDDADPARLRALMEMGYEQAEIAELLGKSSAKAIEAKMYKDRKRQEKLAATANKKGRAR